jgi:geranylgeranyl reductase family protein
MVHQFKWWNRLIYIKRRVILFMSLLENTTVCIIGGGIAGNYLASLLSKKKIEVTIVEEHKEIGKPFQCAGIVSSKILRLVYIPKDLIFNRIKKAEIIAPNNKKIVMAGKEKPVVLDRINFDRSFYLIAEKFGAKYYLGEKYIQFGYDTDGKIIVETNKRRIKCEILVGADGPKSKIGKAFGITHPIIFGLQQRVKYSMPLDIVRMYFDPRWKQLFAWVIPESDTIARIGIGSKQDPVPLLKAIEKRLGIQQKDIIDTQGGTIPFGYPKRVAFNRVVLIGDSACMVKATTGGGIIMIINAAKILSLAIEKAVTQNDFSEKFLKNNYEIPVLRSVGYNLKIHYFIRLLLMRFKEDDFNKFFKLYTETRMANDLAVSIDMDYLTKVLPKLMKNWHMIRFALHILFRNWDLIPLFMTSAALSFDLDSANMRMMASVPEGLISTHPSSYQILIPSVVSTFIRMVVTSAFTFSMITFGSWHSTFALELKYTGTLFAISESFFPSAMISNSFAQDMAPSLQY